MRLLCCVLGVSLLAAAPRDSRETFKLLDAGKKLTAAEVDKDEGRLRKNSQDAEARIRLLAYYAAHPEEGHRERRGRHLLWVWTNDPVERLGLAAVRTGVLRLNCAGDPLADRATFEAARPLMVALLERDAKQVNTVVDALSLCDAEGAERLLLDKDDRNALGRLYGTLALGITGEGYDGSGPSGTDAALRERPVARRALRAIESAVAEGKDAQFLRGAAGALIADGAKLWADGKLDWDYTPLAKPLLKLARELNPEDLMLLTFSDQLPARGARPAMVIRVGGNVQQAQLIRQARPSYPAAAREKGVQGTVRMTVMLGLDGTVLGLRVEKGPAEVVASAMSAVRQWAYKPTLLNGKPCFVLTTVDVNYVLSGGGIA